jgi:5-methylthioadenosine/S-adenosylhomocysteine deaminase
MTKAFPITNPPEKLYGLKGRIVTMRSENDILENGILYINAAAVQAIVKKGDPVPAELKAVPVYDTGGTIFPGLIELHNHLSYNCLPLWPVPQPPFTNRGKWQGIPLYKNLISGPMKVLGKTPGFVEAIVRYVECKCLVAGVTTSQGIMLFSNAGIRKYYQGIVRNVEDPIDPQLPRVDAHIPDIASRDASHFLKQLEKASCLLLHLSEGTDETALGHFTSLEISPGNWAITGALAGIHCVRLRRKHYDIMRKNGASMVWSPMSNLMLYGETAQMAEAKASGITIGIGSDWSPSGSKNLLGELKVAKLYSENNGNIFSNFELLSMATANAAKIIRWDQHIGTLEVGKLADCIVVNGASGDPYEQFLHSSEKDLNLVVINGTPRCGSKKLMRKFGNDTEAVAIGKTKKQLNLIEESENPVVGKLTLADATVKLAKGLKNLKSIAEAMPALTEVKGPQKESVFVPFAEEKKKAEKPSFVLVLDHDEEEGENIRPHLSPTGQAESLDSPLKEITTPEPADLPPIQLDLLCVDSDKNYFKNIKGALNIPSYIKTGLEQLYQGL